MEERKTRRRLRRVRYEANVYIRGARQEGAVVARAHNLSAEGIHVSALELPAEGEEVECRLMLGGRRTRLRGRVAWVHRAPPAQRTLPAGGGIQFISLDRQERELLARLVDSANDGPQLVDVWVPGLEHPLPMRALIGTDDVKLGMALPQLVVGMPLRISFVHRGVSESRNGTIQAVRFLSGDRGSMSRVALQVSTPRPRDSAGMISTEAFEQRPPHLDERPSESMIFDLAAMSVPGAEGQPQRLAPGGEAQLPAPPDDRTPVIPYDAYEPGPQGQYEQAPYEQGHYAQGQPAPGPYEQAQYQQAQYLQGQYGQGPYEQGGHEQGRPSLHEALLASLGSPARPRRWWIPASMALALIAAVVTGIAISSSPPPPSPPAASARPSLPAPAPASVPAAPAARPPPSAVVPALGIQPLAPRALDRAGARAAKRRRLRAARRKAAGLVDPPPPGAGTGARPPRR